MINLISHFCVILIGQTINQLLENQSYLGENLYVYFIFNALIKIDPKYNYQKYIPLSS